MLTTSAYIIVCTGRTILTAFKARIYTYLISAYKTVSACTIHFCVIIIRLTTYTTITT